MSELADQLRRLHEEATPGPWEHVEKGRVFNARHLVTAGYVAYPGGNDPEDETPETLAAEALTERTGVLIATLRNALPALADLVEAVEGELGLGPSRPGKPLTDSLAALRAALEEK